MKPMSREARALISAARPAETPTGADRDRVRARVLAKIAAAGAVAAAASAAKPAAAAAGAATPAAAASAATPAAAAAVVSGTAAGGIGKAIVIGVVSAIAAIGAFEAIEARDTGSTSAPVLAPPSPALGSTPSAAAESKAPAPRTASAETPPPPASTERSPDIAGAGGTADSPPRAQTADRPASLRDELTLLKEAQQALAAGDRERALALFDAHERKFGDGELRAERLAGRAIALCSAGPSPQARRAAAELFAANAGSLLDARVRAACAKVIGED